MKKYFLGIIVVLVAGTLIYLAFSKKGNSATINPGADIIYFHGQGCPHCANVEEFMVKNNVDNVVKMEKGEIFLNKSNAEIFKQKAASCNIPDNEMGVPLLWVKGRCYSGDKEIIEYLQEQLKK